MYYVCIYIYLYIKGGVVSLCVPVCRRAPTHFSVVSFAPCYHYCSIAVPQALALVSEVYELLDDLDGASRWLESALVPGPPNLLAQRERQGEEGP